MHNWDTPKVVHNTGLNGLYRTYAALRVPKVNLPQDSFNKDCTASSKHPNYNSYSTSTTLLFTCYTTFVILSQLALLFYYTISCHSVLVDIMSMLSRYFRVLFNFSTLKLDLT